MSRNGLVRSVRWASVSLAFGGSLIGGAWLLDLLVRPEVIDGVGTPMLLAMLGLFLLPMVVVGAVQMDRLAIREAPVPRDGASVDLRERHEADRRSERRVDSADRHRRTRRQERESEPSAQG